MDVEVRRRDLPGLGRQFEIECDDGTRLAVVVMNDGARHLYTFAPGAEAASGVIKLEEAHARTLGAVLAGVYYEPIGDNEEAPAVLGAVAIDWLTIHAENHPATVGELVDPDHPTASLVALMRGSRTIMKPGPDEKLQVGDQVLVTGHRADIEEVRGKVISRQA
ncbi:cation:proton antiporter regulatory subunit [Thermocrispum agreste]|jgi:K+/H+ antiporter YhaU regulatory subunit KhtT|uniref:TrkA C-terminal domain-containing protein n=1 Tax=Thermocrispum agreste TaxID=37925 RepID=A0A2W4JL60_9PSEU|nr:TrkA C-terminal domain-containing protein [Thermocrispum agreste]PZM99191.1 MAG: hypothetical protein DIU77_06335 [Thermocrispum agreste]